MSKVTPLVVGGAIAAYALGRAFHEAFGDGAICLGDKPVPAITRSSFFTVYDCPQVEEAEPLLAILEEIADDFPDQRLVLVANTDWFARFTGENRERLLKRFVVPFPTLDVWEKVIDKYAFAQLCDEIGVPTPPSREVTITQNPQWTAPHIDLRFPVVVKTIDALAYDAVDFPEKQKVYTCQNHDDLASVWGYIRSSGFEGRFLVQEFIPGDDTCGISLTYYIDAEGNPLVSGGSRVLVEDHNPRYIGNPAAMLTTHYPEIEAQGLEILKKLGYSGFANMDVKIDPRDGKHYFFEVNPRVGRNCYYMVAAGLNPVVAMAQEHFPEREPLTPLQFRQVVYSLMPLKLVLRYLRSPQLKKDVVDAARKYGVFNPVINPAEKDLIRRLIVWLQTLNYYRKMNRFYPYPEGQYF